MRALFCSILAVLAGCGSDANTPKSVTYTLNLFGFGAFAGQRLELKIKNEPGTATVHSVRSSVRPDGTQSIVTPAVLEVGKTYRVDYYVDFDADGAYTPPDPNGNFRDPSWRRMVTGALPSVVEGHTRDDRPNTNLDPF